MKPALTLILTLVFLLRSSMAQTEGNQVIQPQPGGKPSLGIINMVGIGALLKKHEGKCVIMKVLENSGAKEAGLLVGDVIASVDGKDVSELGLFELSTLLRGNPDTTVILKIERPGQNKPLEVKVNRHPIKLSPSKPKE